MGHVVIRNLQKEYIERRCKGRSSDNSSGDRGDNIPVLSNITAEFNEGEMVCILGPSGCGKSTLLRIIAGFDKSFSGSVLIDGKMINGPNPNHIFIFQQGSLFPWMTVWQNIGLGLRYMKDRNMMKGKIRKYVDMVELEGFEYHYPYQLSGGMQRRVELARALAVNPDLLFMDEPFTGLDFLTHMRLREEVVNMHEFIGKTIIFVTHDIDDALIMGDRVVVLGGRPACIKLTCKLDFPRPRDFENMPELSRLRSEIFFMLGVPCAV